MGICSAGVLTSAVLGGAGLSWPASLLAGLGASLFLLALVRPADVRKERMRDLRLEELTRSLELIWDPAQLQSSVIGHICDIFGTRKVALFLRDPDGERFVLRGRTGAWGELLDKVAFEAKGRLAGWLRRNQTILSVERDEEVVGYLSDREREVLEGLGVKFCLPFSAMNRLVGMALIAGGDDEVLRNFKLLEGLSFQAGLALENSLLYEGQKLRLRRLYRAERLATVGQLAAGAAHEIRNPLATISSTIQYINQTLPPEHKAKEMAEELLEEVERIDRIVEGLLSFARPAEPKKERVSIRELLEQTALLLRTTAKKVNVEIETEFLTDDDRADVDPSQMKQVFLNVAINAIQAMPEGGKLRIRLSKVGGLLPEGRSLRIEFEDTGVGMSPEQLERAFDPFYTTKSDGTGLGLPISYSIVRSHGGEMDIESEPGKGTTVRIEL
ncbi:MAG: histidine kinase [Candidatus Latescibacterota bacterium]|nr:MAG: histidine kinase [Candidatus Latescibacterota bacterium]